jgi:hypothetical protein
MYPAPSLDADYVIVDGYSMDPPSAPGIEVHGNHITVQNSTVTASQGDDGDAAFLRQQPDQLISLAQTVDEWWECIET